MSSYCPYQYYIYSFLYILKTFPLPTGIYLKETAIISGLCDKIEQINWHFQGTYIMHIYFTSVSSYFAKTRLGNGNQKGSDCRVCGPLLKV